MLSASILGIQLVHVLGVVLVVLFGGAAWFFTNNDKGIELFNKTGMGKDNVLDMFDVRDSTKAVMRRSIKEEQKQKEAERQGLNSKEEVNDNEVEVNEKLVEMEAEKLFRDLEQIEQIARGIGKQEEKMKGEGSEKLYNMVVVDMFATLLITLLALWQWVL